MAASAGPAMASLTETQAEALFQKNVQDPQCGRGASWGCEHKRWPEAHCYQGYSRWECSGGVEQVKYIYPWNYRGCGVSGFVKAGIALYEWNQCFP